VLVNTNLECHQCLSKLLKLGLCDSSHITMVIKLIKSWVRFIGSRHWGMWDNASWNDKLSGWLKKAMHKQHFAGVR